MADHRITLELANAELEDSPIRLSDLVKGLSATRTALVRTDRAVAREDQASLDWRVVSLTYSSPYRATVEPIPEPGYHEHGERVIGGFFNYAKRIDAGSFEGISTTVLRAFARLADPVDRGRLRVSIRNGTTAFNVPRGMGHKIEAVLSPETSALGSLKGQLEYINLHGATNVFRIYPVIGPNYVKCHFPDELKPDAKQGIGRNVRVHGRLHYREREDFPYRMQVSEIDILPLDSDLPSLRDVLGMAPDATAEMSSEEFVRDLRIRRERQV